MHDTHRVGLGERIAGLHDVVDRFIGRDRAARKARREVLALQVLHDHERPTARRLANVVDADDVLGANARRELCLSLEPVHEALPLDDARLEIFDGDPLVQLEVHRHHHDSEPSFGELAFDAVLARDDRTRCERPATTRHPRGQRRR